METTAPRAADNDSTPPVSGGALTAATILETAAELFSTIGYDGTSVREIAKAVGIKPASLYNHYLSKEEILWGVIRRTTLDLESRQQMAVAGLETATERLTAFVHTHTRFNGTYTRDSKIANVQMYALSRPHFTEIAAFRHRYEVMLQEILQSGADSGEFRVDDVKVASYAILQMGIGIAYWFNPAGPLAVEELCRTYEQFALRMVGATEVS